MKEVDFMAPDYTVIGRRIREARVEQNLGQEELADKMNISVAIWVGWKQAKGLKFKQNYNKLQKY